MHTFHTEQWLPFPTELVFDFFANPVNLPRLMPSWHQARIEDASIVPPPPRPFVPDSPLSKLVAGVGTRLTLSFRPFPLSPVRLRWEAEIDSFLWNQRFSDIQLRGPFAHWHHVHTVTPEVRSDKSGTAISGTLLRDEVEYEIPFGRAGNIFEPLISEQLRRTFIYRHERTRELLIRS